MKSAILIAALAVGCAAPPPIPDRALPDDDYVALRTHMTELVGQHCGKCHIQSSPEAKPAALAIFDLEKESWPTDLWHDDHALSFQRRIAGNLDEQQESALADLLGAARFRMEER